MFSEVIKLMDSFLDMGVPGYDCAIYQKGKCIFRHMAGVENLETKAPITGKEKNNIYSCSKLITVVAALQLYEQGKFGLYDKLSDYMPEFTEMYVKDGDGVKKAVNPITIWNLFTMTAGFTYRLATDNLKKCREDTEGRCPTREVMKYLAKDPLIFEPGTRFEYSVCHDVLAALVEVISGIKFEEYVKKNIFDRLGMDDSSFLIPYDELDSVATHYQYNTETEKAELRSKIPPFRIGSEYASGGAGCVCTVDDYIKFLEGLRTGKLLKEETVKLMTTDQLSQSQREGYWVADYGYGLGVRCPFKEDSKTDYGWGGAAGAYLAIDPKYELSFYYSQHLFSPPNQLIRSQVFKLAMEIIKQNFSD